MIQNLRVAFRVLRKSPAYTVLAVFVLALGIGANTAIFSVVHALVVRPVDFPNLGRIVAVLATEPEQNQPWMQVPGADYLDWKARQRSFARFAAARTGEVNFSSGDSPDVVIASRVTPEFFEVLGIQPVIGRFFSTGEARDGTDTRLTVISHNLWTRRFSADPAVIGRSVRLNGEDHTIIGVAPKGAPFPFGAELWRPLLWTPEERSNRTSHNHVCLGLLKPGVTRQDAQAEMQWITAGVARQHPNTNKDRGAMVASLTEFVAGPARGFILVEMAAVGFVLLIACANVANLQLARALARRKEMAVRSALGAGRRHIIGQVLSESLLLAGGGVVVSLLFATWALELIRAGMPAEIERWVTGWSNVGLNPVAVAFAAVAGLFAAAATAVVPALRAMKPELQGTLRQVNSAGMTVHRMRDALVVAEVALAVVLLIGAVLMTKGFWSLLDVGRVHAPESLLSLRIPAAPPADDNAAGRLTSTQEELQRRFAAIPGVQHVSAAAAIPFGSRDHTSQFYVEGDPAVAASQRPSARVQTILPGYFSVMRIPVMAGRVIDSTDRAGTPEAAVVNEAFVRKHLRGRNPIGARVRLQEENNERSWEIVGVVANSMHHWYMDRSPMPAVYKPLAQAPAQAIDYILRTSTDPAGLAPAVRRTVAEVDPALPVIEVRAMSKIIYEHFTALRFAAYLMLAFACLALVLSCIGVYAVISYVVSERTHEIGIRMALGASQAQVRTHVIRRSMALVGVGLGLGLIGSMGLVRMLETFLYGVRPDDGLVYTIVVLTFLAAGLLAAYVPARRATMVDPMVALRQL